MTIYTNKIPRKIHQIWMQGEELIPAKFKKYQNKIKNQHKGWEYKLWNELEIIDLIKKTNINWLEKYYKYEYMHQKIDLGKLVIMYIEGGIIIDMDAYTKKNLEELFEENEEYDFIISKMSHVGYIGNYTSCGKIQQCINNGIFISKPKANILEYMINNMENNCGILDNKMRCINKTTGPIYFNKIIEIYQNEKMIPNKSKIKILENEYLEPCTGTKLCNITNKTYVIHKHENTWIDKYTRKIIDYYLTKQYELYLIVIVILVLSYVIIKKVIT